MKNQRCSQSVTNTRTAHTALLFDGALHQTHLLTSLVQIMRCTTQYLILSFVDSGLQLKGIKIDGSDVECMSIVHINTRIWRFYYTTYGPHTRQPCTVRICAGTLGSILSSTALMINDCVRVWVKQTGDELGLAMEGMHCTIPCVKDFGGARLKYDAPGPNALRLEMENHDLKRMLRQVNVFSDVCSIDLHQYGDDWFLELISQRTSRGCMTAHTLALKDNVADKQELCHKLLPIDITKMMDMMQSMAGCDKTTLKWTSNGELHVQWEWRNFASLQMKYD